MPDDRDASEIERRQYGIEVGRENIVVIADAGIAVDRT
jgi:hypothetical protein